MAIYTANKIIDAKDFLREKMAFPCSGKGLCGKCKFKVKGNVSEITEKEKKYLSEEDLENDIRLACCTKFLGEVDIETLEYKSDILGLSNTVLENKNNQDIVCAIDIGTTTVVCVIYDINNQKVLAEILEENSQRAYGADVISRITVCTENGVELLSSIIKEQLTGMYTKAIRAAFSKDITSNSCSTTEKRKDTELAGSSVSDAYLDLSQINKTVITGNTTMLHILEGMNPEKLGYSPFETTSLFGYESKTFNAYLPKCVSAYVGADLLCAVLSSDLLESDKVSLLVDIGTNGEMAIYKNKKLVCCSVAAGPAFEGWGLSCGSSAIEGAITGFEKVADQYIINYIGNTPNVEIQSICGSGIISLISILINENIIEESGAFNEEINNSLPSLLNADGESSSLGKLVNEDDEIRFYIGNTDVYIAQKDIRQIQLAKSAICAGVYTLLEKTDTDATSVEALYICGGFGSHLDIDSACNIGLLPSEVSDKIKVIGNAALSGALRISVGYEEVPEIYEEINLSASRKFMDYYIDCMTF